MCPSTVTARGRLRHSSTVKAPRPAGSISASASPARLRIASAARSGRRRPARPRPRGPRRRARRSPSAEELAPGCATASGGRQLVEGDVGGDVLAARVGEVVAAALVAAVGAQPVPPRPAAPARPSSTGVVEHHDPARRDELERRRATHAAARVLERGPGPVGGAGAASTVGTGSSGADSTSTNRPPSLGDERLPPRRRRTRRAGTGGCRAARWRRTTPSSGPVGQLGARLDAGRVRRARCAAEHLDGDVRAAPARTPARRRARRAASVPGPAPASTTVNGSGRPSRAHSASRPRASDGAEQRADLGRRSGSRRAGPAAAAGRRRSRARRRAPAP